VINLPALEFDDLPRAHGEPLVRGRMRTEPEDFFVDEQLGFVPTGAGQHLMVHVEKRGANTAWVARQLARLAGVAVRDVGYAGLKDRHAVTRQWFSLPETDAAEALLAIDHPEIRVLECLPHDRKLRRGALSGNRFRIRLRDISGRVEELGDRLAGIGAAGVPNYFGPQRFGRNEGNLPRAAAMLAGEIRIRDRNQRGLLLSAARSALFNAVLAARVNRNRWDRMLPGEVLMLDGTRSLFVCEQPDAETVRRVEELDLHPTGPLPGRGHIPATGEAASEEVGQLAAFDDAVDALAGFGLRQERRPLRLRVRELTWSMQGPDLEVAFSLPAGAYATVVLREFGVFREA
jgi:tRNA pseudouridine13 synthase